MSRADKRKLPGETEKQDLKRRKQEEANDGFFFAEASQSEVTAMEVDGVSSSVSAEKFNFLIPDLINNIVRKYLAGDTAAVTDEKEASTENKDLTYFFDRVSLDTLLSAIIKGDQKKAKGILEKYPDRCLFLLTTPGDAIAYANGSHKTILEGRTALQVALSSDDDDMVEMLVPYLDKIDPALKSLQWHQQFPKGQEEKEKIRQAEDTYALWRIAKAIENASAEACNNLQMNESEIFESPLDVNEPMLPNLEETRTLLAALKTFREYLEPKETIKTGRQFNMQLLMEAFILNGRFNVTVSLTELDKNRLFFIKVLGYIERFLPACYAQAFPRLYQIVVHQGALERSFNEAILVHISDEEEEERITYFPLSEITGEELGYDLAIVPESNNRNCLAYVIEQYTGENEALLLERYIEKKRRRCRELCNTEPWLEYVDWQQFS